MRVLVACEFTGTVRDAFSCMGHDAWSCDIIASEKLGNHIKGDVLDVLNDGWDLMIAHPPCTYLANSGARWLIERPERRNDMDKACDFFMRLLHAPIPRICIENPIQHKHARLRIPKYNQIVQPWHFGENETKATCLWLKNLSELNKTYTGIKPANLGQSVWKAAPSKTRSKDRARFFPLIALAMANQWGAL